MEGVQVDHRHTQQHRRNKKSSGRLNPCEDETEPWFGGDGIKLRLINDMDQKIAESHSVTSRCNQAFVSLELEELLDDKWAILNDSIVLRLEACSLVPRDGVVLDANQRLSLGGIKSPELVHLKRWTRPLSDIKCSQIWVSVTSPSSYVTRSRSTGFPNNIGKVEQIIHTKFLGHVMTEGQNILLDTSRDDRKLTMLFDITITDVIGGGNSSKGKLARGLVEKNTVIRVFSGDRSTEWLIRTASIDKWRYDFNLNCLEEELNLLEIGGLALPLKTVLEGVFGCGSLPLPHPSDLRLAHRKVKGVILYGPPRIGKTSLANSVHKILGTTKPKIISSDLSPKALLTLFQDAIRDHMINRWCRLLGKINGKRNRLHLFIVENVERLHLEDQPSTLRAVKDRIATMTALMDRLDNVLIIGTTSHFHLMKPNALRAGRFELHVKLDLPNNKGRFEILNMLIQGLKRNKRFDTDYLDLQQIALWTYGYIPVSLDILVWGAVHNAMKKGNSLTRSADYRTTFELIPKGTKVCTTDFYVALIIGHQKIICPLSNLK